MRNPFARKPLTPLALAARDALMALVNAGATSVVIIVSNDKESKVAAAGVDGGPKGLAHYVASQLPTVKQLQMRGKVDPKGGN